MAKTSGFRGDIKRSGFTVNTPRSARLDGVRNTRGTEDRDTRLESTTATTDEAASSVVIGSTIRAVMPSGSADSAIVNFHHNVLLSQFQLPSRQAMD